MIDWAPTQQCDVVAFVHAKGISERLPGKNLPVLGDRPLVCHAIEAARQSVLVDQVVIDSDDDEILAAGLTAGALPLRRPLRLASNETTGDELAYWQACAVPDARVIVQVVPTSPFLLPESITAACELVLSGTAESATGIRTTPRYTWEDGRPTYYKAGRIPNSQDMPQIVAETTGMYAVCQDYAFRHARRLNPDSCCLVSLSAVEAVNVDTEEDFQLAEWIWRGRQ